MAKSLVHTCYTKLDNPQPPVARLRGIFSGLVRVGTNDVGLRLGNRGGRGRARTGGLLVANEALSQLSYTPTMIPSLANACNPANRVSAILYATLHLNEIWMARGSTRTAAPQTKCVPAQLLAMELRAALRMVKALASERAIAETLNVRPRKPASGDQCPPEACPRPSRTPVYCPEVYAPFRPSAPQLARGGGDDGAGDDDGGTQGLRWPHLQPQKLQSELTAKTKPWNAKSS